LAGAVRSDQPEDLALAQGEVHLVEGDDTAEAQDDVVDLQQCTGHRRLDQPGVPRLGRTGRDRLVHPVPGRLVLPLRRLDVRLTHSGATSLARSLSSIARRRLGITPCGRKIMITMMMTPNIRKRHWNRS